MDISGSFKGLDEFREHLGGELTITLIQGIGEGIEVHAMDKFILLELSTSCGKDTSRFPPKNLCQPKRKSTGPRLAILNVVGLCGRHLGKNTPNL